MGEAVLKRRLIGAQTRRALGFRALGIYRAYSFSSEGLLCAVSTDLAFFFPLNEVRWQWWTWMEVRERVSREVDR